MEETYIGTFETENSLIPLEASLVKYENNEPLSQEANPDCCPVCLAYGYYSDSIRTETILKAHWIAHMKYGWRPGPAAMMRDMSGSHGVHCFGTCIENMPSHQPPNKIRPPRTSLCKGA